MVKGDAKSRLRPRVQGWERGTQNACAGGGQTLDRAVPKYSGPRTFFKSTFFFTRTFWGGVVPKSPAV